MVEQMKSELYIIWRTNHFDSFCGRHLAERLFAFISSSRHAGIQTLSILPSSIRHY